MCGISIASVITAGGINAPLDSAGAHQPNRALGVQDAVASDVWVGRRAMENVRGVVRALGVGVAGSPQPVLQDERRDAACSEPASDECALGVVRQRGVPATRNHQDGGQRSRRRVCPLSGEKRNDRREVDVLDAALAVGVRRHHLRAGGARKARDVGVRPQKYWVWVVHVGLKMFFGKFYKKSKKNEFRALFKKNGGKNNDILVKNLLCSTSSSVI